MKLTALFYYDRPLLEAWLNHYMRFDCIDEIIIQDQNWSTEDTLYLLKTVARYIDEYNKKIVILPSQFEHIKGKSKRSQFLHYGQSKIRNRVTQFLQNDTWIASAMDEVIYGDSYNQTEQQLREFEQLAEKRAQKGKLTIGFLPLYCVYKDGFSPCGGIPIKRWRFPTWRHRIFRFTTPFRRKGSKVHDTTYQILQQGKWVKVTPSSATSKRGITTKYKDVGVALDLKLLHYHTLVRSSLDSSQFVLPNTKDIKKPKQHPQHYLRKLVRGKIKVVSSKPSITKEEIRLVSYWRNYIKKNWKNKRPWYYGLPYRWWYGMSSQNFLDLLPHHLDREKEPKWFRGA